MSTALLQSNDALTLRREFQSIAIKLSDFYRLFNGLCGKARSASASVHMSYILSYHANQFLRLKNALKAGTLLIDGKECTYDDIDEMRCTKVFARRYGKFLKKEFHSEVQIQSNLTSWIEEWEFEEDNFNRRVFSDSTGKAARTQFDKVRYVLDCMAAEVYTTFPAPPGSKHGLSTFKSNRPESMLEKFHELLAHYCNVGCGDQFANAPLQRGWAEYNGTARHRYNCMTKRSANQLTQRRALDTTTTFLDHSLLHYISQQSRHLGHLDLFDNYEEPPTKNNGEVFLKNYFEEQVERNKSQLFDKEFKQCICNECMMPAGLPTTGIPAVAVEENDAFRPLTCQLVDGTSTSSIAVAEEPPRPEPMRADPLSRRRRQLDLWMLF